MVEYYITSSTQAIPIQVVSEASYTSWLQLQSVLVNNWLTTQRFSAKNGNVCLIPDANGHLAQVVLGVQHERDYWALAKLPALLPPGTYQLNALPFKLHDLHFYLGWGLQQYVFDRYKANDTTAKLLVLPSDCDTVQLQATLEAIFLVRDLINTPAQDMAPPHLAAAMEQLAQQHQATFRQIIGDDLLEANFPAIHTVGRASCHAPRLLELTWGELHQARITLIGKGVCFDSGGLDLKSAATMRLMKKDMGGAAHVLGLASLIMQTKLPLRLQVLIGAVENSVSANAFRPGDIITTHKGLTVEIDNTDAEGRLVLADALAYACEQHPALIIDMATLTGAAKVALGTDLPAMFSNDDTLAQTLRHISVAENDPVWQMPLFEPYLELIKSDVADLVNSTTTPYAGALTAALFLQHFVTATIPWVHFDIMAWNERARPGRPRGGEAVAIRTLYAFLRQKYVPNRWFSATEENKEHKLGLPLEYQKMPEYFDVHNISEQTQAKNALIEKLLKEQKVKTVLDMTCGTGSQVFYLVERGYKVVGSDFSPALLNQARNKAQEINHQITFIDGDMRTIKAGKFDAVISIFNAIGHLVKADFEKALQNIHANLKDNGIYIFDIFNLQAITDNVIHDFWVDIEHTVNGEKIHHTQHSEIDRGNGFLTSHDFNTILKENGEQEIYKNTFSLQIYTAEELRKILEKNGFEVIEQYDMEGNDFMAEKSPNILTIAKKRS